MRKFIRGLSWPKYPEDEVSRNQKPLGKIGGAFVGIMIIIYFAIHIWTIWISYSTYRIIGAAITLLTPILSQIFWFIQFWKLTNTFFNIYCMGIATYLAIWVVYMCWYLWTERPFS
jgi:hypothetical protein